MKNILLYLFVAIILKIFIFTPMIEPYGTGALIQLYARGNQDRYLTGEPYYDYDYNYDHYDRYNRNRNRQPFFRHENIWWNPTRFARNQSYDLRNFIRF
jgi:hypothetical protein